MKIALFLLSVALLTPFTIDCASEKEIVTRLLKNYATEIGSEWQMDASQARQYTLLALTVFKKFESGKLFLEDQVKHDFQESRRLLSFALILKETRCLNKYSQQEKDDRNIVCIQRAPVSKNESSLLAQIFNFVFPEQTAPENLIIDETWLKEFLNKPSDQAEKMLKEFDRLTYT